MVVEVHNVWVELLVYLNYGLVSNGKSNMICHSATLRSEDGSLNLLFHMCGFISIERKEHVRH